VNQTYDKRAAMNAALDHWAECLLRLAQTVSQSEVAVTTPPDSSFAALAGCDEQPASQS
jgi:hypothetical protein